MKVITARRGEGKTSYILEQCKKLEGRKAIIVPSTVGAECLKNKLRASTDEDLRAVDVYSTYEVFIQNKAKDVVYSYVFVDEMQTVLQSVLNYKLMIGTEFGESEAERIFATLNKGCMNDINDVRLQKSCEACTHQKVCKYALAFVSKCCVYYEEKK